MLIGDASSIRRVGVDGIISTIAGKRRQQGFSGDGGKARDALFCSATNFAVAPDGALWLNDRMNHRLRRIDTDGTVATIAGSGSACDFSPPISSGDGGPALRASIQNPLSIAIAPNGDAYVLDASAGTPRSIRRIAPTLPGPGDAEFLVPSADGGEIYEFAATGRHLRTRNALTSAVTREFGYDADGRLARVTEKTGATDNVTIIEHDATGRPGAIVGPYGQQHRIPRVLQPLGQFADGGGLASPVDSNHQDNVRLGVRRPPRLLTGRENRQQFVVQRL